MVSFGSPISASICRSSEPVVTVEECDMPKLCILVLKAPSSNNLESSIQPKERYTAPRVILQFMVDSCEAPADWDSISSNQINFALAFS